MRVHPNEIHNLGARSHVRVSLAHRKLGWRNETSFVDLIQRMVDHDLESARNEKDCGLAFEGPGMFKRHLSCASGARVVKGNRRAW